MLAALSFHLIHEGVELATEHVLASLDLFVHVERSGDGRRRVSTVAEASRERGIHVVWKAVG